MNISKKLLLLLSLAALSPVALVASEEETKEAAVNPVVVHMPVEGSEWETREGAVSQGKRTKTLETLRRKKAALRLARELENKRKVEERVSRGLPAGPQSEILSFLESPLYDKWRTLNIPFNRLIFNGTNLVSIVSKKSDKELIYFELTVTLKDMSTGKDIKKFTIPYMLHPLRLWDTGSSPGSFGCALSADGSTIAVISNNEKNIELWDIAKGELKRSIPSSVFGVDNFALEANRVLGLNNDGTRLFVRVATLDDAEVRTTRIQTLNITTNQVLTLEGSENVPDEANYTYSPYAFFITQREMPLRYWDLATGEMRQFNMHNRVFIDCVCNNDGTMLALHYYDRTYPRRSAVIGIFEYHALNKSLTERRTMVSSGSEEQGNKTYGWHTIGLSGLSKFSHDNTMFLLQGSAFVYGDGGVPLEHLLYARLFDVRTGDFIQKLVMNIHKPQNIGSVFNSDDTMIAMGIGDEDGDKITLWKKSTALQDSLHKAERIQQMRLTPKNFAEYLTRTRALKDIYFKKPIAKEVFKKSQEAQENLAPIVEPVDVAETDISQVD